MHRIPFHPLPTFRVSLGSSSFVRGTTTFHCGKLWVVAERGSRGPNQCRMRRTGRLRRRAEWVDFLWTRVCRCAVLLCKIYSTCCILLLWFEGASCEVPSRQEFFASNVAGQWILFASLWILLMRLSCLPCSLPSAASMLIPMTLFLGIQAQYDTV